ncbi:MAG: hypothetical protein GY750_01960 [Lentisphaerae bacterium]|nr:hypothetical protein [Lentisphaerota bacterium]MCP4100186.1 hypothetical protein [Lentisphaerota bacterium]
MKKSFWGSVLFALFLMAEALAGIPIEILTTANDVTIPPSMAENGKSFIYAAFDKNSQKPGLFVSYMKPDGTFSRPFIAFNSDIRAEGIKEHFRVLLPLELS